MIICLFSLFLDLLQIVCAFYPVSNLIRWSMFVLRFLCKMNAFCNVSYLVLNFVSCWVFIVFHESDALFCVCISRHVLYVWDFCSLCYVCISRHMLYVWASLPNIYSSYYDCVCVCSCVFFFSLCHLICIYHSHLHIHYIIVNTHIAFRPLKYIEISFRSIHPFFFWVKIYIHTDVVICSHI